jgi:hypothetical protein
VADPRHRFPKVKRCRLRAKQSNDFLGQPAGSKNTPREQAPAKQQAEARYQGNDDNHEIGFRHFFSFLHDPPPFSAKSRSQKHI